MPTNLQSIIVYIIVGLTVFWFVRRWYLGRKKPGNSCGDDCGCSKDGVRRNPAIQAYLKKKK